MALNTEVVTLTLTPYSPGFALSDEHLFKSLQLGLEGKEMLKMILAFSFLRNRRNIMPESQQFAKLISLRKQMFGEK